MNILGISGSVSWAAGNAAAALVQNGKVIAAAEEERFLRVKHAMAELPVRSIDFVLKRAGLRLSDIDILAYYVETYDNMDTILPRHLALEFGESPKNWLPVNHHLAHAASTFHASGFAHAAVLTYDYSGDGICSALFEGRDGKLREIERIPTSTGKSLGKFYAAFTQYLGFDREDEYKVMGLSAYGDRNNLIDLSSIITISHDDVHIDGKIFTTETLSFIRQHLFNEQEIEKCLGIPPRHQNEALTDVHKQLAISVQVAFEEGTLALLRRLRRSVDSPNLCLAGGCAMNCVSNGRVLREAGFANVFVPPVASDTGGALGSAYVAAAEFGPVDPLSSAFHGPDYTPHEILGWLDRLKVDFREPADVAADAADEIGRGKLIGWFQGRGEYGPRALGARSILANPRDAATRDRINKFVKFRETFRPFAPSVIEEESSSFFDMRGPSPYMNFVSPVKAGVDLPAITHVDGSARVQTVPDNDNHAAYRRLLKEMDRVIGAPVVLNTSFNINGQPIVNTPHEAIYTFFSCGLDSLYVGPFKLTKPR